MIAGLGAQVQAVESAAHRIFSRRYLRFWRNKMLAPGAGRGTARGTFHTSSSREPRAREGRDARAHIVVV